MAVNKYASNYETYLHRMGRWTLAGGFLLSLLPSVLLWLIYGISPPFKFICTGFINISVLMLPVSIIEVLTFAPMLGAGALYMSYLTGNITNLKIPCAAMALEAVDVKPGTREGDIIANIAIGGSVLAAEVVLIAGVLLLAPIISRLEHPALKPAFEQILPALFGAIGAYYILKEWKLAIVPLLFAVLFSYFHLPSAVSIPLCIAISIAAARFLYKKNMIKAGEKLDG